MEIEVDKRRQLPQLKKVLSSIFAAASGILPLSTYIYL